MFRSFLADNNSKIRLTFLARILLAIVAVVVVDVVWQDVAVAVVEVDVDKQCVAGFELD